MATQHRAASVDESIEARNQLLIQAKAFTRLRDELSQRRRELPWQLVANEYLSEGLNAKETLLRVKQTMVS